MDTITYDNHQISIEQDNDTESPLEWTTPSERGATFVLGHNRYDLPNELDVDFDDYTSWSALAGANIPVEQPVAKFVHWYEHGGIALSLSDTPNEKGWDSGCAGVIYGEDEHAIKDAFLSFKQYIEGDVYQYLITDQNHEFIDSLGGIYGYYNALGEAKDFVDTYKRPRSSTQALKASQVHG